MLVFAASEAIARANGGDSEGGWQEVSRTPDLVILTRDRAGSPVKEVRAIGEIDAPPAVIKRVIGNDAEYPRFMPYTKEVRILTKSEHAQVSYMLLDPPLAGQRDFTIKTVVETSHDERGRPVFLVRWSTVNNLGPPPQDGVTRVSLDEGSWLLESATSGNRTRATYTLFTDGGGNLPPFVVNLANRHGLSNVFAAVRKEAQDTRYQHDSSANP